MHTTINTPQLEYKSVTFTDVETKEQEINGVPIGIIKGMASTFGNIDLTDDVIEFGAFEKTIANHKSRHDRPVRMMIGHDRFAGLIGGFPIDKIKEQKQGLKVEGQINLDVQRGREAFSLAKMGVLTDLSIGFIATDVEFKKRGNRDIRVIKEIDLREISIVDEPANQNATINEVKNNVILCNIIKECDMIKKINELENNIEQYLVSDARLQIQRIKSILSTLTNNRNYYD